MARPKWTGVSPWWRRQVLTIPPDSPRAWIQLIAWEAWMGVLLCAAVAFGTRLIVSASSHVVTVIDYSNCFTTTVRPCEQVTYKAGELNVLFNVWFGVLVLIGALWLMWELWGAVAPKPITDDFLQLLDDSFARDWRKPQTWPWARIGWAYGFTSIGAAAALSLGLAISSTGASAAAQAPVVDPESQAADQPAPRTDQNSSLAHAQLLEKAKSGVIDVYFVGDSIVRRWGALDYPALLANWRQNFHGWNAANFGWGGDRTQNILWRLENGELDGVNPKVIVILAGTNNVGQLPRDERASGDIARGVKAILDSCRKRAPNATLVLTAIFPRGDSPAAMPAIDRINRQLATFADGSRVRFLTINDRLTDSNRRLLPGVLNERDQLHPTLAGYQIWAEALKPLLRELLGPPADSDLAPPPTGDPSVVRRPGR